LGEGDAVCVALVNRDANHPNGGLREISERWAQGHCRLNHGDMLVCGGDEQLLSRIEPQSGAQGNVLQLNGVT
jgi:hypothetical protein